MKHREDKRLPKRKKEKEKAESNNQVQNNFNQPEVCHQNYKRVIGKILFKKKMDKPSTYMIKTKSHISKQFKEPQEKEIWHSIIKLLENTVKEKRKKTSKE